MIQENPYAGMGGSYIIDEDGNVVLVERTGMDPPDETEDL